MKKWHTKFHDVDIKYIQDVPNDDEWNSVKSNSLVVLDDLFVEAVNSESCSKAFKVYARKRNFSIVVVSQVSTHLPYVYKFEVNVAFQYFFDRGPFSPTIRNNIEAFVLFQNHGCGQMNKQIADRLGYGKQFNEAAKTAYNNRHGYILILCTGNIPSNKLRVCTNFFSENNEYPTFFV